MQISFRGVVIFGSIKTIEKGMNIFMKKKTKRISVIISVIISTMITLTACNGGDDVDVNDFIPSTTQNGNSNQETQEYNSDTDQFMGVWTNYQYVLTLDGYGNYHLIDHGYAYEGKYEIDGDNITLDENSPDTRYGTITSFGVMDFENTAGTFEKELSYAEDANSILADDSIYLREWQHYREDIIYTFNSDGTFSCDDTGYIYYGTHTYQDGTLTLTTEEGIEKLGYFYTDPNFGGTYVHLNGYEGYFFLLDNSDEPADPSETGHTTGLVGEWFDENSGIIINFYDNDTYAVSSLSGDMPDIPYEGEFFWDYSDVYLFEPGEMRDYNFEDAGGKISLVVSGDDFGKIYITGTDYYFTKISETPSSSGSTGGGSSSGGSSMDDLGFSVVSPYSQEVVTIEDGGAYYDSSNTSDFSNIDITLMGEIISDEIVDGLRQLTFATYTMYPISHLPSNSEYYALAWWYEWFDAATGFVYPATDEFRISDNGESRVYEYEIPDGSGESILVVSRPATERVKEGDHYILPNVFVVYCPLDYHDFVFGIMPYPSSYSERLSAIDESDYFEYGTTINEINFLDVYNGFYWSLN